MYCPKCGMIVDGDFCKFCGTQISPANETAHDQISVADSSIKLCTASPLTKPSTQTLDSTKNRWLALFLCVFLGMFGVHRFYVGKNTTGGIWLLTGGVFLIGWMLDIVKILCGNFCDINGDYLK